MEGVQSECSDARILPGAFVSARVIYSRSPCGLCSSEKIVLVVRIRRHGRGPRFKSSRAHHSSYAAEDLAICGGLRRMILATLRSGLARYRWLETYTAPRWDRVPTDRARTPHLLLDASEASFQVA